MSNNTIYIIVGLLLAVAIFLIIYFNKSEDFADQPSNQATPKNTSTSNISKENGIKYFGGSYCPHSKVGSRAYLLIKDFELKYPDITVKYYWTGEDNEEFTKAQVEYVPTVTNKQYNKINLTVPDGVDTNNKSDNELKELVLLNIHHQL